MVAHTSLFAPIYTQIEEAVDFVLRNIRLGATIDGLVRKEKYELPPEAIREMIINAHCHRNLLDESCIQVAVYDDRLEVTSPGGLYNGLTYEEVMNGHSKIRNKGIANIFSQMGLVEAWGSGIKRILNAAEEYGTSETEIFRNLIICFCGARRGVPRSPDCLRCWKLNYTLVGCAYIR